MFASAGYLDAGAESIAREAGMSKATFYEHFANKEECILAIFDNAVERISEAVLVAADDSGSGGQERVKARVRAFLKIVADNPDEAQTLLVEMVGAGPRASERRDAAMRTAARQLFNAESDGGRYPSEHDAFAVVGAAVELVSRQLRRGEPQTVEELQPVIERLAFGQLRKA